MPKIVRFSKNKRSSKGCGALLVLPIPLQSWSRSKSSASVTHSITLSCQCSLALLVTSNCLHYSFYQITLYPPFPILYYISISWSSLVSYPLSRPLLLLQDCFHSTVAPPPLLSFNFWLPSSCPGSRITNPFVFPFKYIPHDLHARVQALFVLGSLFPLHHIHHVAHSNSSTLDPAPPVASIHVVSEWRSFRFQSRPIAPCSH